ncbi:MAG TPA: hypothetical protein VF846_16580, partial [Thermoanaerobaculia bacterium]
TPTQLTTDNKASTTDNNGRHSRARNAIHDIHHCLETNAATIRTRYRHLAGRLWIGSLFA